MKIIYILIISLIFSQIIFAAKTVSYENLSLILIESDTLNTNKNDYSESKKSVLIFGNQFYFNTPAFLNDSIHSNKLFYTPIFQPLFLEDTERNNISPLYLSKLQLNKAMKMNYNLIKKNNLGTFGKILGGAVGISAVGLGIYHLIKYKDDYFK